MLLTADWHLDDRIENDYRWRVFDQVKTHAVGDVFILGDLCDRADRHSGALVNRLIAALDDLAMQSRHVTILCGNHDQGLKPPPYWEFLNRLPYVTFITKPTSIGNLLLLPYSSNPKVEWHEIPFNLYDCVMLHQTVTGVDVGHGRILENPDMVSFPYGIHVYSGDIHICQTIGNVTYVGAPHPVRFGDTHRCRFLLLDQDYSISKEITLRRMRKAVIEVSSLEQLKATRTAPGDQARIRFAMPPDKMAQWPIEQAAIAEWAREHGVQLASIEAIIETNPEKPTQQFDFDADPEQVLAAYCAAEGIGASLHQAGLEFLSNSK